MYSHWEVAESLCGVEMTLGFRVAKGQRLALMADILFEC